MSDRSATWIGIGGTIASAETFGRLLDAIEGEAGTEWEGSTDREDIRGELLTAAKEKRIANFYDNERAGGCFEELEQTLQDLGLPYHRADDGHYAYAPENAAWKPGMKGATTCAGTSETGPAIYLATLLEKTAGQREAIIADVANAFDTPPLSISGEIVAQIEREEATS